MSSAQRILAIDPGIRFMGVAVLEADRLIYRYVHIIPSCRSGHESVVQARSAVLRLIKTFRPEIIALERAFFARNPRVILLHLLINEIRSLAQYSGLRLLTYAPSTVKKRICGHGRASKREVSLAIVARFPELKQYLTQDQPWKARFHQNMFDAIAIGLLARQDLSRVETNKTQTA